MIAQTLVLEISNSPQGCRRHYHFPDTKAGLLVVLTHVPFVAPAGLLGRLFPSVIHPRLSSLHESAVAMCRLRHLLESRA